MVEKRDRKNDAILYSSLVDFWSVLGGILGPKIDQKSTRKSIEFRSRFWEAFLRTKSARLAAEAGPLEPCSVATKQQEISHARLPASRGGGSEGFASAASPFCYHERWSGCCLGDLGSVWGTLGVHRKALRVFGDALGFFGGPLVVFGEPLGSFGGLLGVLGR